MILWFPLLKVLQEKGGLDLHKVRALLDFGSPPGVDEAIAISHLVQYDRSDFEKIIIDTAPTGHTLRLLQFP